VALAVSSAGTRPTPTHVVDCGNDVELRIGEATPAQGGVFLVEVAAPPSAGTVEVTWDGRAAPAWRDSPRTASRFLVGVDLERPDGLAALVVTSEATSPCRVDLAVQRREFEVSELQLPARYVDLQPRDQERAERYSARLDAIFSVVSPERLWRGAFRLPIRGARVSDNFGRRRILNGEPRSPHAGVDFAARRGTPVRAPQAGRVALASTLFFSGRTVVLDHGLGLYSFYGHLSSIAVRVGQRTRAGTLLGRVGATGRATGPHLHWSIRLGGARVDPLQLIEAVATPGAKR
jgi:hypothetical protein